MIAHALFFLPDGTVTGLHTDAIPLQSLGPCTMRRASTVEFDHGTQLWQVSLWDDPGRPAFSDPSRDACLAWERDHITRTLEAAL